MNVIDLFVLIYVLFFLFFFFFFSSRRRHTRCSRDWSSDVCSSDLEFDATFELRKREADEFYDALIPRRAAPEEFRVARQARSEERRVGKEWRSRWARDQ